MKTDQTIAVQIDDTSFIRIEGIETYGDGSGFGCRISLRSGAFACTDHPFYFDGLDHFLQDMQSLYRKLSGKARLGHTYEPDYVEFEGTGLGHVLITAELNYFSECPQSLKVSLKADQTYLPPVIDAAEKILKSLRTE